MYRAVIELAREDFDPGDMFGWCQSWRFAICDYLYWDLGEDVPGFRPGLNVDVDSYPYSRLVVEEGFEAEELNYALKILDRYREWLRRAGEDY